MKDFSEGGFNGIYDTDKSGIVNLNTEEAGVSDTSSKIREIDEHFDIVTGTPPYFPLRNGALPQDAGRGQCAFECRGGIEAYLGACARNLSHAVSARCVLCQTFLEVRRTEASAKVNGLIILKRLDVYGKVGQSNPLFCVFSMRKMTEETNEQANELDGRGASLSLKEASSCFFTTDSDCAATCRSLASEVEGAGVEARRVGNGAAAGYIVIPLYVRKICGCHTAEYDVVMKEMGRPNSSCNCLARQSAAD